MANVTIMDLPAAPVLTGGEYFEVVQPGTSNGVSKRALVADIRASGIYTDLVVAGTATVAGATTLGSTLGVAGAATLASTLAVAGAAAFASTMGVTGAATFASTVAFGGVATFVVSPVFRPAALPAIWAQMNPADAGVANAKTFSFATYTAPNASGDDQVVHMLGWNIDSAGNQADNTDATSLLSFEQDYDSSGSRLCEMHWQGQDTDGTAYRWLTSVFVRGSASTTLTGMLNVVQFGIFNFAREERMRGVVDEGYWTWLCDASDGFFAVAAGDQISFSSGSFIFRPYTAAANRNIEFLFTGGSREVFKIVNSGGDPADLWIVGPSAESDSITLIRGGGIGICINPGTSSTPQALYTVGRVVALRVHTAAGAVTVAKTDDTVVVNKTVGAATTVNLPASPATGERHTIKDGKGDASTNFITIAPAAGNIDGASTLPIRDDYASVTLEYNGTQWNIISRY